MTYRYSDCVPIHAPFTSLVHYTAGSHWGEMCNKPKGLLLRLPEWTLKCPTQTSTLPLKFSWATLISTIPGNISVALLSSWYHTPLQLHINWSPSFRKLLGKSGHFHPEGLSLFLGVISLVLTSHAKDSFVLFDLERGGTFSGRLLTDFKRTIMIA